MFKMLRTGYFKQLFILCNENMKSLNYEKLVTWNDSWWTDLLNKIINEIWNFVTSVGIFFKNII